MELQMEGFTSFLCPSSNKVLRRLLTLPNLQAVTDPSNDNESVTICYCKKNSFIGASRNVEEETIFSNSSWSLFAQLQIKISGIYVYTEAFKTFLGIEVKAIEL